jgi:hypothetical protein
MLDRSLPRPLLPDDPIKIVRVLLDAVEVKAGLHAYPADIPGVPFQAGDDWFNHLTVVLKNISAKNIVHASIWSSFVEPARASPGNEIGNRPRHAQTGGNVARPPVLIEPSQEFSLQAIDPDQFDEVKQAIENREPLSSLTTASIRFGEVYFEDGTRWTGGAHYRPDYSAPGKYVMISQKEFDTYRQDASQ